MNRTKRGRKTGSDAGRKRVTFTLPNTKDCVNEAAVRLEEVLRGRALPDEVVFDLKLAVQEAVVNAAEHGNRCDEGKRVHVTCEADGRRVRVTVRDEGAGFDPASVPDPTLPENILKEHGRGLFLMRSLCDEVRFNETGNEVTLVKELAGRGRGG